MSPRKGVSPGLWEQERTYSGTENPLAGTLMQRGVQLPRNHQKSGFPGALLL